MTLLHLDFWKKAVYSSYTHDPYDTEKTRFDRIYKAKSVVKAIYFPKGFEIVPPWGGQQSADGGYLFLNGSEVYGCEAKAYHETYEVVRD
jgi:hypothetical protein